MLLRSYFESDVDAYFEYMSQPEIGGILGFPPYTDKEKAKERLIKETNKNSLINVKKY